MESAIQIGTIGEREHHSRYATWTQTRDGGPSPRTKIRGNYSRLFRTIGERERDARNAQQNMNWQNKCQRLIEVCIMCGDKPWPLADLKTVTLLYLSIGVDGRRILNCKNPHTMIVTLTTVEFWKIVEEALICPRNLTFDRHLFLITKQLRGETVEQFYGKLKELAENCDFENKEETLIRDVFITNQIDPELQKELLEQTIEPRQALENTINMELGNIKFSSITRLSSRLVSTQSSSLTALEPRFCKTQIIFKEKTTAPHSIVQTLEEFGFRIVVINVSQKVKRL